jgi:radical S-adenosyl methionine domain-containing protein 2
MITVPPQNAPQPPVESVNFHCWQPCNMHCRFCFGRFRDVRAEVLPNGHLTANEAVRVVELLADAGFRKITFAGGEPFLCPWLPRLLLTAKQAGMITCAVTNGSILVSADLAKYRDLLDWLTLSVDSSRQETLIRIGRATAGRCLTPNDYLGLCSWIHASGIRLKLNTVVSRANVHEDMLEFVVKARPRRWKIMQVLPIHGQNDQSIVGLMVSHDEFLNFIERHARAAIYGIAIVPEDNESMTGSYAMLDPAGRFFDNIEGFYTYSPPILTYGVHEAIKHVTISRERFLARGGDYDWRSLFALIGPRETGLDTEPCLWARGLHSSELRRWSQARSALTPTWRRSICACRRQVAVVGRRWAEEWTLRRFALLWPTVGTEPTGSDFTYAGRYR